MVKIWLDDIRPAPIGWIWAKDVGQFIHAYEVHKGDIEVISLDHDLGEELTGYDAVKFIVYNSLELPRKIYLHTANPIGRENMYKLLINYMDVCGVEGTQVYYGPNMAAWEESIDIAKSMGWIL